MKKISIYLLMLILLVSTVFAVQVIPIYVNGVVDFDGERDFTLKLPNNFEKHFYWENNESHSDYSFNHTILYKLDEDTYCKQNVNLENLASQVEGIRTNMSDWAACKARNKELEGDRDEYERIWKIEEGRALEWKNSSLKYELERDECADELSTKSSSLTICNQQKVNSENCCTDLDDCKSSKTTTMVLAFGAGLVVGYLLWKKKKVSGPSEHYEQGSSGDETNENFYQ